VAAGTTPAQSHRALPLNDEKAIVLTESPLASAAKTGRRASVLVAFMWIAYFLNYCDRQVVFSLFPVLKSDLGFTNTQLGLTGSIFLWVYGIGCPLAGQAGDKISKRLLVVLSLALWSLVTIATGFASSAVTLLALRACMGISEALYMPSAIALTANAYAPSHRSRAIAALTTAQIAGTVGGGWFGGWMAEQGRWRGAFFILGAVGIIYAIPYSRFLLRVSEEAELETKRSGSGFAAGALLKVPTYLVLCFAFPVFVFGLWLLYGWLPNFLHEKFALGLADAAFNATVFLQAATLVGILSGGLLADWLFRWTRAARIWLLTLSLLFCAPCIYELGHSTSLEATRLAAAAFGLFSGFFMGNIFPAAFEIVPGDTRASAVGVLNFFGPLVSGFAPLMAGLWKESLGFEGLTAWTAAAYLLAGIILVSVIRLVFPRDYERAHLTK
jgi:MFS family permease